MRFLTVIADPNQLVASGIAQSDLNRQARFLAQKWERGHSCSYAKQKAAALLPLLMPSKA
ncbi:hypothetical protein [Roseibium sp. SCP14]|uniref:hypothetical protein n=1 Tax=Roseibium sp. SCP14 TaxID=3141375 RepID=UPI00333CFC72